MDAIEQGEVLPIMDKETEKKLGSDIVNSEEKPIPKEEPVAVVTKELLPNPVKNNISDTKSADIKKASNIKIIEQKTTTTLTATIKQKDNSEAQKTADIKKEAKKDYSEDDLLFDFSYSSSSEKFNAKVVQPSTLQNEREVLDIFEEE